MFLDDIVGQMSIEEAKATSQRLDAKCWKGKHKEGTKVKGGVRVNNCVPNESQTNEVAAGGAPAVPNDAQLKKMIWDALKIDAPTGKEALQKAIINLSQRPQTPMVQNMLGRISMIADNMNIGPEYRTLLKKFVEDSWSSETTPWGGQDPFTSGEHEMVEGQLDEYPVQGPSPDDSQSPIHGMEEGRLTVGDPVVVTAPNEFEGKTGEIAEFSPSGKFVVVNLYNYGEHSMHLSDVEYNQYADEEDDIMENNDSSPVAGAIVRRIMMQRTDLLKQYGPELVGAAVDNVADYVGDVEEIGSSDVSGWVAQVERMLEENPPEAFAEGTLDEISRRDFLKGAGATAGLAAMGGAKGQQSFSADDDWVEVRPGHSMRRSEYDKVYGGKQNSQPTQSISHWTNYASKLALETVMRIHQDSGYDLRNWITQNITTWVSDYCNYTNSYNAKNVIDYCNETAISASGLKELNPIVGAFFTNFKNKVSDFLTSYRSAIMEKKQEYQQQVSQQQSQQKITGSLSKEDFDSVTEALMLYAICKEEKAENTKMFKDVSAALNRLMKAYNNKDQINSLYPQVKKALEAAKNAGVYEKEMNRSAKLAVQTIDKLNRIASSKEPEFKENIEQDVAEGFQDFNKVEPYAVCLAGKCVKKFDYYEEARRFHDNWKQKLYREGDKAKADTITLMPLNLDEEGKGTPVPAKEFARGVLKDLKKVNVKEEGRVDPILIKALSRMPDGLASHREVLDAAYDAYAMELGKMHMKSEYGTTNAYIPQLMSLYKDKHGLTFNEAGNPAQQAAIAIAKKKQQGVEEDTGSWIVYDPATKQIKKRFKTHTAGKSYAKTHGLGFASSEYYFDNIKEKEAVTEFAPGSDHDDNNDDDQVPNYLHKFANLWWNAADPEIQKYIADQLGSGGWTIRQVDYDHVQLKHRDGQEYVISDDTFDPDLHEASTDYSKRRQRERDIDAGKPVTRQPKNPQTDYAKKRAEQKRQEALGESYWIKLQNERSIKLNKLVNELQESIKDIK